MKKLDIKSKSFRLYRLRMDCFLIVLVVL